MAKSIIFEGIDGSGKSTLTKLVKQYLEERGKTVLALREPGGTPYYEAIREHVHFQTYQRPVISDVLTCAGGIAANIALTKTALLDDTWVISDRSFYSNAVYQIARGFDAEVLNSINALATEGFAYDFKFLIDLPVLVAQGRLAEIGKKKDRYEALGKEYFEEVRQLYLDIAKKEGFIILDGQQPVSEIIKAVTSQLGL